MNTQFCICFLVSVFSFGCTAFGGGLKLPEKCSENFSISFYEGGGMFPESETYFITPDSAGRESFYQETNNRWVFKPDQAMFDVFYEKLRALNPLNISSRDEGIVHDRGGVTMQLTFDKTTVNVANSGGSFVVAGDQQRFNEIFGLVAKFVVAGLHSQTIQSKVVFSAEVGDSVVESYSVNLGKAQIAGSSSKGTQPLPTEQILDLLPGQYQLAGWAKVGLRSISISQVLEINPGKHDFHILLKNDTFELKQQ